MADDTQDWLTLSEPMATIHAAIINRIRSSPSVRDDHREALIELANAEAHGGIYDRIPPLEDGEVDAVNTPDAFDPEEPTCVDVSRVPDYTAPGSYIAGAYVIIIRPKKAYRAGKTAHSLACRLNVKS